MGLYLGGLIIRRICVSEIWGAYFREGLLFYFIFYYLFNYLFFYFLFFIILFFLGGGGRRLLSELYGTHLIVNVFLITYNFRMLS